VVTSSYDVCDTCATFTNNGDGTFSDRSVVSGLARIPAAANLIQADYNNDVAWTSSRCGKDGRYDAAVSSAQQLRWHLHRCDPRLRPGCHLFATQTALADIDNDGWLDVFVADEQGPSQLYRNRGDGTFENISATAGVDRTQFTKGLVTATTITTASRTSLSLISRRQFPLSQQPGPNIHEVAEHAGVQQSWRSFGTLVF